MVNFIAPVISHGSLTSLLKQLSYTNLMGLAFCFRTEHGTTQLLAVTFEGRTSYIQFCLFLPGGSSLKPLTPTSFQAYG